MSTLGLQAGMMTSEAVTAILRNPLRVRSALPPVSNWAALGGRSYFCLLGDGEIAPLTSHLPAAVHRILSLSRARESNLSTAGGS